MKLWKVCLLLLAVVMGLWACRPGTQTTEPSGGEQTLPSSEAPETTAPTQPPETTEPEETTQPPETTTEPLDSTEPQVIRTQDVDQTVLEGLMGKYPGQDENSLPMMQASDRQSLDAFLLEIGSQTLTESAEIYDGGFFASYDLLLVPRVTNTGSARHTVEVKVEGNTLVAELTVTVPEIHTMDMANWVLLIPVAKADAQGRTVEVRLAGSLGQVITPAPTSGLIG